MLVMVVAVGPCRATVRQCLGDLSNGEQPKAEGDGGKHVSSGLKCCANVKGRLIEELLDERVQD